MNELLMYGLICLSLIFLGFYYYFYEDKDKSKKTLLYGVYLNSFLLILFYLVLKNIEQTNIIFSITIVFILLISLLFFSVTFIMKMHLLMVSNKTTELYKNVFAILSFIIFLFIMFFVSEKIENGVVDNTWILGLFVSLVFISISFCYQETKNASFYYLFMSFLLVVTSARYAYSGLPIIENLTGYFYILSFVSFISAAYYYLKKEKYLFIVTLLCYISLFSFSIYYFFEEAKANQVTNNLENNEELKDGKVIIIQAGESFIHNKDNEESLLNVDYEYNVNISNIDEKGVNLDFQPGFNVFSSQDLNKLLKDTKSFKENQELKMVFKECLEGHCIDGIYAGEVPKDSVYLRAKAKSNFEGENSKRNYFFDYGIPPVKIKEGTKNCMLERMGKHCKIKIFVNDKIQKIIDIECDAPYENKRYCLINANEYRVFSNKLNKKIFPYNDVPIIETISTNDKVFYYWVKDGFGEKINLTRKTINDFETFKLKLNDKDVELKNVTNVKFELLESKGVKELIPLTNNDNERDKNNYSFDLSLENGRENYEAKIKISIYFKNGFKEEVVKISMIND